MNHCKRCGHKLSEHDGDGTCTHRVTSYGHGSCACAGYLRTESSLAELTGQALYDIPGRDAIGQFYSPSQAKHVGLLVDALLDETMPSKSIDAIELCEGWRDASPVGEVRWFALTTDALSNHEARLYRRGSNAESWHHTSTISLRDAAAKAIMKAGNDGAGS